MNALGIVFIFLFIILLGIAGYFVYENYIKDQLFPSIAEPEFAPLVEQEEKPIIQKEVYNIGNNLFKYDDAEHLCKAFGSELATHEQLEKAFEKGADWCNYGWSQDQMALYPTQKSTWENLQKGPKMHRKDCGVPGINGGYFENKNMRFGVNCYGIKPNEKPGTIYKTVYKQYDAKTEKFKKLKDDLIVLPFDSYNWNRNK